MTSAPLLPLDPRARRCWGWLPALGCPGRVFVSPWGEVLLLRADGGLDVVITAGQPWDRSIAADPAVGGRARRYP